MKLAVIGCGYWGKNLVRNFYQLGVLKTVADSDPIGLKLAKEIAPGADFFGDYQNIWNDDNISAVVIATPADSHYEICKKALLNDKDVFCEKPLALTYEEASELVHLSDKCSKMLMVGHILEYHPAIHKIKELIKKEEIGKIQYIYSNRLNLGKIRKEENILWSFAPHDISVILSIVGKMPFQVVATGGNYIQPNVEDVTITQLLFDNGVNAHIFVSWINPYKEQKLVIVGSKAMITFDDVSKELILYDKRVDLKNGEPIPIMGEGENLEFNQNEPLKLECEAFIESVETRKKPLTDGDSALKVLKVLQSAQQSLMTKGQSVMLPL